MPRNPFLSREYTKRRKIAKSNAKRRKVTRIIRLPANVPSSSLLPVVDFI